MGKFVKETKKEFIVTREEKFRKALMDLVDAIEENMPNRPTEDLINSLEEAEEIIHEDI